MATDARRPSLGLAACAAIVIGNTVGGAARGVLPRIGVVEAVAFLFSIFTVYGCGPTPVLYGLLLLLFGIPVYVWQQHERARGVAAHRVQ
jgi:basic amino acid/polyamine antiporter, APA family